MKDDKIQTGLRIPQARYEEICSMAKRSGTSVNAIILHLIDIGISSVNRGVEEESRVALRNQKHSYEQCTQ